MEYDKVLGIFGVSAEAVAPYKEQGFSLLTVGVDSLFLQQASAEALKAIKNA
jgi:2-keto-3-deoxy-L-rhamnonate aldolase RhmA